MSWDATLSEIAEIKACPDCGRELEKPRRGESEVGWWNYTHNVAPMIYDALKAAGIELALEERWWQRLSGMTGADGREYLGKIVRQLEGDPARYRAMNPPNGWGDYDRLLGVLREMRDAAPEGGAFEWHASG